MPTRENGSNFSPTVAPCELRSDQLRRKDRLANASIFAMASSTAARNVASAPNDAAINSERDTANCSGSSFAPSKRSVSSLMAASPRSRTAWIISRECCSTTGSNKLEEAIRRLN
jgi:hypothetical protein